MHCVGSDGDQNNYVNENRAQQGIRLDVDDN